MSLNSTNAAHTSPSQSRDNRDNMDAPAAAPAPAAPPASLPLYLAAFVTTGCGLYATGVALQDAAFTNLVFALAGIGFLVSYISRRQNISPQAVELPALLLCGLVFVMAFASNQPFLAPPSVENDRARSLAVLLTWLTVFRSFTLLSDGALLFCCVPSIALLGLVSTIAPDTSLLNAFIVMVCGGAFLLVHENYLRTRYIAAGPVRAPRPRGRMMGSQLQAAAVCVAGAMILANVLVVPLQAVGSQLHVAAPAAHPMRFTNSSSSPNAAIRVTEDQSVDIATGHGPDSDQVLMVVDSPREDYWRGATFDFYTGHGWRSTLPRTIPLISDEISGFGGQGDVTPEGFRKFTFRIRPSEFNPRPAPALRRTLTQHFALQSGVFSEVFAASEPRVVQMPVPRATADSAGVIHLDQPVSSLDYTVTSEAPDTSEETLRALNGRYPREITDTYLQLPTDPTVAGQLHDFAVGATRDERTTYDRVLALERAIGAQCKYNLDAPAVPSDQDVATTFLFKAKQGYCDSFAAALTLLCRSIGIPARVASGFLSGERSPEGKQFVVRERDMHQWTEVYFPTAGWVRFDATAFAEDVTDHSAKQKHANGGLIALLLSRGILPPLALLALVLMLAYVAKVEIWDRLRPRRPRANPLGLPERNAEIVAAYGAACALLARRGLERRPAHTPWEYLAFASDRLAAWPEARAELERLTTLVVRYRYGCDEAAPEDAERAQEALARLREALKRVSKNAIAAASVVAPAAGTA